MASLVPDNLASRKDVPAAIRRVARAFQVAADDDVTVWYEPLFDPRGPASAPSSCSSRASGSW
jgi:hypothetical protein